MTRVVFLLAPGVHLLDLAGPAQVFSTAADHGLGYDLVHAAEQDEVRSAQGVVLRAGPLPDLTPEDLVVVPGWRSSGGLGPVPLRRATLGWLRDHHTAGGTVASVCAGADALGRAGLLHGRRCTTHHELQDDLARRYPGATVVRDVLYVVDGTVVTSAGIASGIDLALHVLATRHGPAAAARAARAMVVHIRRNGDEQQVSALLRHRAHVSETVHRVQDTIESRLTERLPLAELARVAACSERTVTREFARATGTTPLRYQQELRLERAEHLIGQGTPVESAARAVGFADARMLRRLRARPHRAPARPPS
ncbi:Transcriptional regulator, AraC family [Actinokineospora spheciospongiae]|uniref:Transcriptional regulator, AraC family n=1 Tax=Actinokineospora spheciospongiae TaxID=909613 RepID=W7IH42_9PSEU|nr:DJ-1/PfpI family protein [Actinokineospora spheciospongiae]EWC60205.1 Transcriptional regulator, AraC family [Actinokineospora spheciospongiae]PWW67026.1 AraC family transcriptional regulator with amidase-like domain [Actinokineospora spheciospongiae]